MEFNLFSKVFLVVCITLITNADIEHETGNSNYTLVTHLVNDSTIEFILTVKTTGWIGVGVNHEPNMVKADLAIITEANATHAKVEDFHDLDVGTGRPVPDTKTESDWISTSYDRNETTGIRKVIIQRLLNTNDEDDLEITENPMYIVWAYGATDELEPHIAKGSIPEKVNLKTVEGPGTTTTTGTTTTPTGTTTTGTTTTTPTPGGNLASDLKGPVAFVLANLLLALAKFI